MKWAKQFEMFHDAHLSGKKKYKNFELKKIIEEQKEELSEFEKKIDSDEK